MANLTLGSLNERVDRLERENRYWRKGAALGFLVLAGTLVMGQAPKGQTLEGERLIIRDAKGVTRATLGPEGNQGALLLKIFGKDPQTKEQASAIFGVVSETPVASGAILGLTSRPGPTKAAGNILAVAANINSSISLNYGKTQGGLMAAEEGTLLSITDKEGRSALFAGSTLSGPSLALADGQRPRLGMTLGADGAGSIKLLAKDGAVLWKAP